MSYYRPSFSQTVAMSRGSGRGYSSRGSSSYSGRGSSWSDRGRGSFSSSRGGRFSSYSANTSFDSRSRYQSSPSGRNESYSSSRGREDPSYHRSYRSDAPNSYSSTRDSSHRSPERKRIRLEASSSRRSHDGGYGAAESYSGSGNASRYESSYNDRRSFNDDRRPSFKSREDFRKPTSMSGPGPIRSSPRGGYRGRLISRGIRGGRLSSRDTILRRRLIDSSSYVRKRGASLRATEFLRRKMISRARSTTVRRPIKKREKTSDKEDSDKEENWDEENEAEEKKDDNAEEKGTEDEEGKKTTPTKKIKVKAEKEESDKEEKKSVSEDERPRSKITGRPFIKLACVHCGLKCVTFKDYTLHLFSGRHISTMRKIAFKQKGVVARMRLTQRNKQRELEKNDDTLPLRPNFCPICKLNYRQPKSTHQLSESHRKMKKFLMPYCRVCLITFKSPMLYENHICSLEHIRRKAHHDLVNGDKNGSDKEPSSPAEDDLENFMTLDSVGDVDEGCVSEEDEDGNKGNKSPNVTEEGAEGVKTKEQINVGAEHVKKIEVYFCNLCNTYLARSENPEQTLKEHCRCRRHLTRYVRLKEDTDLRKQAERIHRKNQEAKETVEKEKEKDKDKDTATKDEKSEVSDEKGENEPATEEEAIDDKIWADVDKDLGEILAEVNTESGNKSSDEDEDSRPAGERYDRFRYSEKGGEEKAEQNTVTDEKDQDEDGKVLEKEETKVEPDEAADDK